MDVLLALSSGSKAGVAARIREGYYMIGRHRECQIRPKSRSVSRQHCLIQNNGESLQVFDLNSSSGTRVNGTMIDVRRWVNLSDQDELRCGKVSFNVALSREAISVGVPEGAGVHADASLEDDAGGMGRGAPWQEADIASFLLEEDEVDQELRYDIIRELNQEMEDAETDQNESQAVAGIDPIPPEEETHHDRLDKIRANRQRNLSKTIKTKGISRFEGLLERYKYSGMTIVAVLTFLFVGYQLTQMFSAPEIRIIENLD